MFTRLATLAGLLFSLLTQAQSSASLYEQVTAAIRKNHPALQYGNKIIACSFWSQADNETRELNTALDHSVKTYQVARLAGGTSGLIGVAICLDADLRSAKATLTVDGAEHLVALELEQELVRAPKLIVFDSSGRELYRNLPAGDVFMAINKLITR